LINKEKKQFQEMLDTLFDIYNRKHADQNLLRVWWSKLHIYPVEIVSKAFDDYTSSSNKCPTPYDIILLCRSKNLARLNKIQPKLEKKVMSKENKDKIKKRLNNLLSGMRKPI